MKALIGGTGLDRLISFESRKEVVSTPYGKVTLSIGMGHDVGLVFLSRHGEAHDVPPHLVNYRANIAALHALGVTDLVAVYAVGSITDFLKPGESAVVGDFLDFTSSRTNTFYEGGESGIRHVPMDNPFSDTLRHDLLSVSHDLKDGGVYAMTNGPRLETKAEIKALGILGADYVGMTLGTEATLANEAGIRMAAMAYSINWASGIHEGGMDFLSGEEANKLATSLAQIARRVLI